MSVQGLMNQPLTVQGMSQTATDGYGDPITTPAGDPVVESGYLEMSTTTEYQVDRETTVTKWKAFLQAGTTAGPLSYINFEAQKFQVDGLPWQVYNPRTRQVSHIECNLVVVL